MHWTVDELARERGARNRVTAFFLLPAVLILFTCLIPQTDLRETAQDSGASSESSSVGRAEFFESNSLSLTEFCQPASAVFCLCILTGVILGGVSSSTVAHRGGLLHRSFGDWIFHRPSTMTLVRPPAPVGILTRTTSRGQRVTCACCAAGSGVSGVSGTGGQQRRGCVDETRVDDERAVVVELDLEASTATVTTVDAVAYSQVPPTAASISRLAMYNTRLATTRSSLAPTPAGAGAGASTSTRGGTGRSALVSVLSSAVVVGATVATAVVATVRSKLKAVRECGCCQGYGVERCKLCEGKGTIQWEGKMAHREPCPMCLGRRLVKCSACGGGLLFSRSLFTHKANKGEDAIMDTLTTLTSSSLSSRLFGRRSAGEEEEARIAASEEFSKEVLSD